MNIQLEGNVFQAATLPFDPTEPNVSDRWLLLNNLDPTVEMGELVKYVTDIYAFRGKIHGKPVSFTIQSNDVYLP